VVCLALVDNLDLDNYYAFLPTRADLLSLLGRDAETAEAYAQNARDASYDSRSRPKID
jgi:predicted RNA polymerase sigma factor